MSLDFSTAVSRVSKDLQLRVAILLDDEDGRMRLQKSLDIAVERKRLDAQIVHDRFSDGPRTSSASRIAPSQLPMLTIPTSLPPLPSIDGLRQVLRRVREFSLQAVENHLIFGGILGVAAILIVARAAREVGALGAAAGQGAVRDRIVVAIHIAIEFLQALRALPPTAPCRDPADRRRPIADPGTSNRSCRCPDRRARTPAFAVARRDRRPVRPCRSIPRGSRGTAAHAGYRRAMRTRTAKDLDLLRARRHAGGRPDPLHVENDAGHFGVVREADELVHQGNSRSAGRA